jgi:predicted metal-dependent phosphoesterase TrpH
MSAKWLKRLLAEFKQAGGDGLEVALSQQTPQARAQLGQYCLDFDLLASGGSDFHFPTNWCELGKNLYLSDKYRPIWHNWPN